MEAWIERYVSYEQRPEDFMRLIESKDELFTAMRNVRWKQDEQSAIPALLHMLSPAAVRNVRYDEDGVYSLWLACARDRVLVAVVVEYFKPGDERLNVRVKRMDSPIESRIFSTLVGEVKTVFLASVFEAVRFSIPNLLRNGWSSSFDVYSNAGYPELWHKLLALVGQVVKQPSTPVHDTGNPSVMSAARVGQMLSAVRIGRALVVVRKVSHVPFPQESQEYLVVQVAAQYFQ